MNKYYFYDWDCHTNTDLDLSGEAYKHLIWTCCRYCKYVSFSVEKDSEISELEKFRVPASYDFMQKICKQQDPESRLEIRFYVADTELCDWMCATAESIFEWIRGWAYNNPEDPIFYREDGSVFLKSCIHEGELTLLPRKEEDITVVISAAPWKKQL